jgi:hypothetical protein
MTGTWATSADVKALRKYEAITEADVAPMLPVASRILWRMSGRRWAGIQVVTGLRPCHRYPGWYGPRVPVDPWATYDGHPPLAYRYGPPLWWGVSHWCGATCGCVWSEVDMAPYAPVRSVEEIRVDGATLDPAKYVVLDGHLLARTDGGVWPLSQDLTLPDTEPGTWAVDLTWGQEPPPDAVQAAAVLAAELALALNPSSSGGECELPARVQSITRQGVSMLMADPMTYFDGGRTGLYIVDLFLASANPEQRRRAASLGYVGQDLGPRHRG